MTATVEIQKEETTFFVIILYSETRLLKLIFYVGLFL